MVLQKQLRAAWAKYAPAEQARLVLWVPVLFAAGILGYFALENEPYTMQLVIWPAMLGIAVYSVVRRRNSALFWIALTILFSGFAWSVLYTDSRDTRMLREQTRITNVEGTLTHVEQTAKGWRLSLKDLEIDNLEESEQPSSIRLNMRSKTKPELHAGDRILIRAGLLPPSGPVMQGGFDFARFFFFRDIGAVGYALPPAKLLKKAPEKDALFDIAQTRMNISERLIDQLGLRIGSVAAALMIGDRTAIPESILEAMRISNLSHILAISGMHMALVTGIIFIAIRFILAALPLTQHNPHNKKIAALFGLVSGLAYLVLADYPISAVRAFVMVALLLGAVLLDREVQPMRSLAWAAMLLLIYNPANVLEPGFQLSFVATMGLIAWYEQMRAKQLANAEEEQVPKAFSRRLGVYFGTIMLTTLVAELVTAPLVIYHFNNASFYGIIANLVVMPIIAFVVMPFVVLTYLLWQTPLAEYCIEVMGYGIEAMLIIAEWIEELPYAEQFLPAPPGWAIAIATFGLVWICLMRERWRFWGLALIVVGMLPIAFYQSPDFYFSHDRSQIALKLDGQLQMVKGRGTSFATRQWANGNGRPNFPKYKGDKQCDEVGCIYEAEGMRIGVYQDYKIVPEDYCPEIDLLIATFYWNGACEPEFMLERNDMEDAGSHWGWYDGSVRTTNDVDGSRPWSRY